MSQFIKVKKKCAICGNEQVYTIVLSTNAIGHMDLDTRPPEMKRSCLPFEIQKCNKCHYANDDIEMSIPGFNKALLQSSSYQAVVNNNEIDPIAKAFLLAGHLYSKSEKHFESGQFFLKAAWIFDDLAKNDFAIRARKKAIENFDIYANETENINITVLLVDLERRIGNFSEASDISQNLIEFGVEDLIEKILKYEIHLSNQKDSTCHNIGEIK